jgi:multidrug efflux pump subunit AcrA (membrane-fusion protein)
MKTGTPEVLVLTVIAVMAAACERKQPSAIDKSEVSRGAKVETMKLASIDDYYEAVGTVRSRTSSVLSSKVVGAVTALQVREGDRVRAGQVVVEVDSRDAAAQLQKAQAGLREAQDSLVEVNRAIAGAEAANAAADANEALAGSTYNRYKTLLDRKSVSPQEYDEVQTRQKAAAAEAARARAMLRQLEARRNQAEARIEQAKADIANAQVYLSYARIASPINGIVTARRVDPGYTATPGAPLVTVEDDSRYRLEAVVEESEIGKIRIGDTVQVRVDALGAESLACRVGEITPASDPASRSYIVKVDIGAVAGGRLLRSGMYGKALFVSGQRQAITVPSSALIHRGQLVGVYTVDASGTVLFRLIKTGKLYGDRIEVLSGLDDGDRIVVEGVEAVAEGNRVE